MSVATGVNFINVLHAHFLYKILEPKFTKLCFGFEVLVPKILYEKHARITLMKLTPGVNSPTFRRQFYLICN